MEQLAHRQGQNIISEYRIDLKNGPDPKNLIVDFDEFDREEVISKYERMMAKEAAAKREMLLSKNHLLNGERDNQHLEIKKEVRKASGITITPL